MNGPAMTAARFWEQVDRWGPFPARRALGRCWLWTGAVQSAGYGKLNHQGRAWLAHRFAKVVLGGVDATGRLVTHRCDTPLCVRPSHLRVGTHASNFAEMVARRRQSFGVHRPGAKLTDATVREIRALAKSGWTHRRIAARYGISVSTACYAINGSTWAHVA